VAVDLAVLFGVCLLVSGVAIRVGIALAGYLESWITLAGTSSTRRVRRLSAALA
jgi:hypothetical protein